MKPILFCLIASFVAAPALAEEWLSKPYFQIMNQDANRDSCFDRELKSQWAAVANEKTFWQSPLSSEQGDKFDAVVMSFCTEDHGRPGYCGTSYKVTLTTSTPKGWAYDYQHSDMQHFFVTAAANDLGRHAEVAVRKTGEKKFTMDIFGCRSFLGVQ